MKPLQRIGQLVGEPAYRTKLAFFALLGAVAILASFLLQSGLLKDILVQFSVTFVAVALIQILWDFLGGDPLETRLNAAQNETLASIQAVEKGLEESIQGLDKQLGAVAGSMTLLADLADGNIGIARLWPTRRAWQSDPEEGLSVWHQRLCSATKVSIAGNTLWNNWLNDALLRKRLLANVAHHGDVTVRLVLYDPDSEVLRIRARDEGDIRSHGIYQMQNEIESSLAVLAQEMAALEEGPRARLEVRLTDKSVHVCQLVWADERMLVALYLAGKSGGPCPTFELRGPGSAYYATYAEQFEILWNRARPLTFAELQKYGQRFEETGPAPVER